MVQAAITVQVSRHPLDMVGEFVQYDPPRRIVSGARRVAVDGEYRVIRPVRREADTYIWKGRRPRVVLPVHRRARARAYAVLGKKVPPVGNGVDDAGGPRVGRVEFQIRVQRGARVVCDYRRCLAVMVQGAAVAVHLQPV